MKNTKIALSLVGVFVTAPIWYYLLYKILVSVNASELMWFLFWIYLPVGLLLQIIKAVVEKSDKE